VRPPPDSPAANQQGCNCPVAGDGKGEGVLIDGVRQFTVNPRCPLHSNPRAWLAARKSPAAPAAAHHPV
jgi:hypothetical protein